MGKWAIGAAALVVVLAFCGGLGGLALMGVQRAREAANAAACKNNLRWIALGAMNHHDQRGDNVPMGMYSGGVSWAGLMLPYVEQPNLWRQLRLDLPYDAPENSSVLRTYGASMPFYHCPSRRHPSDYTNGNGVCCDYAVPSLGVDKTLDDPRLDDTWMQCHDLSKSHGPLLLVHAAPPDEWQGKDSNHDAQRYRSPTSPASFIGGASHQVLFGEKALSPGSLGKDGKAGDFTVYSFIENNFNASGPARPGNGGISPSPYDHPDTVYQYWGSWHPNVCQFAFADGRVDRLSVSMNASVLARLCDRTYDKKRDLPLD